MRLSNANQPNKLRARHTATVLWSLLILLSLSLSACKQMAATLSPREIALAQTRFVQQAATNAAPYAGTLAVAQQEPGSVTSIPTEQVPPVATDAFEQSPQVPAPTEPFFLNNPTPTQPLPNFLPSITATKTTVPATQTPSRTSTSATPATAQTGWDGEWTIAYEISPGTVASGTLSITRLGDEVNAEAQINGAQYTFTGQIFSQDEIATGSYQLDGKQGVFWWTLQRDGKFQGCLQDRLAFCGARAGQNLPEPCLLLPTR